MPCRQGLTASTTRPGCAGLAPCSQEGLQSVPVTGKTSPLSLSRTARVVKCMCCCLCAAQRCSECATASSTHPWSAELAPCSPDDLRAVPVHSRMSPCQLQARGQGVDCAPKSACASLSLPEWLRCPSSCLRAAQCCRRSPKIAHIAGGHLQSADSMPFKGRQPPRRARIMEAHCTGLQAGRHSSPLKPSEC